MIERAVTIVNTRGLHARSAAKLVAAVKPYNCKIELRVSGKNADCSSIMALMMLAAGKGTEVFVCADGQDAEAALENICALIDAGFDEVD